jgi:hypothetical protein
MLRDLTLESPTPSVNTPLEHKLSCGMLISLFTQNITHDEAPDTKQMPLIYSL